MSQYPLPRCPAHFAAGSHLRPRGFSLVETCVVLAVISILASVGIPQVHSLMEAQHVGGIAQQLATDIRYARSQSTLRAEAVRLSFHTTSAGTCYLIHTGRADDCSCNASGASVCVSATAQVLASQAAPSAGVAIASNVPSMSFEPRLGIVSPAGTVRIEGLQGRAVHHVVSPMGRIRTCIPSGSAGAGPSC